MMNILSVVDWYELTMDDAGEALITFKTTRRVRDTNEEASDGTDFEFAEPSH